MATSDDSLARKVQQYGWAVVKADGDESTPVHAFSVGLYKTFSHPEIIVFGLPPATLHRIVDVIGDEIRRGRRFQAGEMAEDVLTGYPCTFRDVAAVAESYYMGIAVDYYGSPVPALHCVWPDREGRFPWDPSTSAEFRRLQPMLSDGPESFTTTRPVG